MVPWIAPWPYQTNNVTVSAGLENATTYGFEVCLIAVSHDKLKKEQDKEERLLRERQERREASMRGVWRKQAKQHDFRQRKWSMDRPRCR